MDDVEEFRKLVAESPHVLSYDVRHLVYQLTEIPGYGGVMRQLLKLLQEAPSDIDGAYARYEAAYLEATEGQSALEDELAVIDTAMNEGRFDEVISRVDAALPIADGYGLGVMTATLYEWSSPVPPDRVELSREPTC